MKSFNVFLLLVSFINVYAQKDNNEWIQIKKDCGLDANLAYNTWVTQGYPCNKAKPAVNNPLTNANTVLAAQEEAEKKAKYEAEQKAIAEAEAKKKKEEEEKREKEKQDALKRMNGSTNQSFGLTTSPDFDGLKSGQKNSYGLNSSSVTPSNDPMVVDAQNVPSGLAKSTEKAIDDVYKDSPAGVKEKVKKAFQSIQIKDWKVAKVWFQEALKLDMDDKRLQTFVLLSDYSYEKDPTSSIIPDPYFKMDSTDQEEIDKHFKDLREGKGSWPSPEKIRNYINSISLDDYIKRYNLVMPEKDDVQYLFPKNKNQAVLVMPPDIKDFDNVLMGPAGNNNSKKTNSGPKKTTNSK
jgi:hypothetical protein